MMSLAVSPIGQAPPRAVRPKLSPQLVSNKLQDNGERAAQVTKSTTLFPMRICDNPGTMQYSDKNLPVSNNFQNFYPQINLSNTLSDKKPLYIHGSQTNAQKYNGDVPKNNVNIINQYHGQNCLNINSKFSTGNETEININENEKLKHIPTYVKCFTCFRIIKEDDFSKHLLFGHVKCTMCNVVFRFCPGFQVTKAEFARGNVLCPHKFYYCKDPVQYLTKNLSVGNINDDPCNDAQAKLLMEIYIQKLKSLENQHPWDQAITSCKEYLDGKELRNVGDNISYSKLGISSQSLLLSENRKDDYHENFKRKKCTEVVMLQDYDISLLEKTTEFVKVLGPSPESLTSSEKVKKVEKTIQESQEHLSDEESIEFVPTPSDGFYYVSVKPIEECPNCYEVLCPSQFTVNVENFLMTVVCEGCSLTIYITSAAPELQIITDDTVNQETSLNKKGKEYGPRETKKTQVKGHRPKKTKKRSMSLQ